MKSTGITDSKHPSSIWCLGDMLIDTKSQNSMETGSGLVLEMLWNLTTHLAIFRCTSDDCKNIIKISGVTNKQNKTKTF